MLSHIRISNYQSLTDVQVELQPFTVIVGPSSSGKSAFTRAMKCLTSNQRGDSFITHGEQQTTIIAKTDRGTVALQRGKKNEYTLIPEGDTSQQRSFTKLSGNVPEEVSEFIGIPAKDPLNYSNQFDMPYLLTASAGEVARTLGELTNVSVIFEAAREANRQRLSASSMLKTRAADYQALTADLDKYRTLKEDLAAVEEAELVLARAKETQTRIHKLRAAIKNLQDIPELPTPQQLPDISEAQQTHERLSKLRALIREWQAAAEEERAAMVELTDSRELAAQAQEDYLDTLKAAGTCPTCGQNTEHVHDA